HQFAEAELVNALILFKRRDKRGAASLNLHDLRINEEHMLRNPLPLLECQRHFLRHFPSSSCSVVSRTTDPLELSFMSLTKQQALELFHSDDLIGIGMEADAVRRRLHPEGVATYIIDRNINYTNFCTEYCTFCAFYAPIKGPGRAKGYVLDFETIYEKIRETVELGGTGVLMQGGLHPDMKIEWYEEMMRGIKQRFPRIHLHCFSASEIIHFAEVSGLTIEDTIRRLRDAGLDSIPGGGA